MRKTIIILFIFLFSCNTYKYPRDFNLNEFVWNSLEYNPIGEDGQFIIIKLSSGQKTDSLFFDMQGAFNLLSDRHLNQKKLKYYLYNKINDWDTIIVNNLDSMRLNDTTYDPLEYNRIKYNAEVDSIWHLGKCKFISYYFSEGYIKDSVDEKKFGHIIYLLYMSEIDLYTAPIRRLFLPLQYPNK